MREEPFSLKVDGFDIVGLLYIPEVARHPGLIISHGIPAGVQDPDDRGYPALAERFCAEGFLTAIFNFRGCGLSGGDFDMRGWTRDLEAVTDNMLGRPDVDHRSLTLMGFSGGAAVSVYQGAADKRVTSVIACACPARFEHFENEAAAEEFLVHARQIGIIRQEGSPTSLAELMEGFAAVAPERVIARIAPRPLLLLHGDRDTLVPVEHARRLYRAAGEPKRLLVFEGLGHRLRPDEAPMSAALNWLKDVCGPRSREAEIGR